MMLKPVFSHFTMEKRHITISTRIPQQQHVLQGPWGSWQAWGGGTEPTGTCLVRQIEMARSEIRHVTARLHQHYY